MKRSLVIIFLIIISPILPLKAYALDTPGEEVKLYVGEPQVISVSNPSRIVIGNPNVADVVNVTKREITLSPKSAGITNLVVWDNFGEQSYRLMVFAENVQEIKRRADNLLATLELAGVYTQAAEEESKVLLLGIVKTPQDRERISTALGALRDKIVDLILVKEEEAVVDIDVQVLELSKDATNTLGFTWPGSITLNEAGSVGLSTSGTKWSTLFKVVNGYRSAAFSLNLAALVQEGKARVLSRPRLACQSGKEAQLLVGGEKPVFTTSTTEGGATSSTIEYKEYGIKLKIKPTVAEQKRIKLGVDVEVSEVGTVEMIGSSSAPTARAYPLTKRTASTELYINDGETIAIGGLIKQKTEEELRKVPWLADVPVLGLFFRQKTTTIGGGQGQRGNTELFITLTPTIVSDKEKVKEETSAISKRISSREQIVSEPELLQAGYISVVQKRILENLKYPNSAKEAGFQGVVTLGLRLSYTGALLDVTVKSSSGYNILDENTLNVARKIKSYPPFPSAIDQNDLWIEVPIAYRLD